MLEREKTEAEKLEREITEKAETLKREEEGGNWQARRSSKRRPKGEKEATGTQKQARCVQRGKRRVPDPGSGFSVHLLHLKFAIENLKFGNNTLFCLHVSQLLGRKFQLSKIPKTSAVFENADP